MKQVRVSFLTFGTLAVVVFLSSCSHTWVVKRDLEGGVIGYSGISDQNEANTKIAALIDCPNGYYGLSDEMKQSDYQYTSYETVRTRGTDVGYNRYNAYASEQNYETQIPVTRTATKTWREFTYKCKPAGNIAMPGTGLGQPTQSKNSGIQPGAE